MQILIPVATIIGGVVVFVVSQYVQRFALEPIQAMQKAIGETLSILLMYANTCEPAVNAELQHEASRAFREKAALLHGLLFTLPHKEQLGADGLERLPEPAAIEAAITMLIGLADSVGSGRFEHWDKRQDEIRQLLTNTEFAKRMAHSRVKAKTPLFGRM